MTIVSPTIQELARRILALEALRAKTAHPHVDQAVQVAEKLQVPLSRLTGPAGFSSLLTRALALSKAEVPSLRVVQVRPDGSLTGFDAIEDDQDAGALEKGRVALVAHLLGLLATFIGESLTWHLTCEAWPGASLNSTDSKEEAQP